MMDAASLPSSITPLPALLAGVTPCLARPQLSGSRLLPTSLQPPAKQATGFTGAAERPYTEHLVMNERIAH